MIKDAKVIAAIAVAATVIVAGVGIGIAGMNNNGPKTTDVQKMSWSEIVDAADGTDVQIGFYFDAYCVKWFNDVLVPLAKERYNINLTNKGYVTEAGIIMEWNADRNAKGSYDFIWGRSSNLAGLLNADGKGANLIYQSDWQSKMPNMALSDTLADETWKNTYESIHGEGTYSREVCSVAPFSGSTTTFIFNKAFNDPSIGFDEVKVRIGTEDYVVKIAESGEAFDKGSIDTAKTYSLSSVRAVCRGGAEGITCFYGLPHNFTELAAWVVLYPYQIYIPSAIGAANFHVQLILEAMIYELASKNEAGTEWTACTDGNAYVWSHDLAGRFAGDAAKDKATYKEHIESKVLGVRTAEDYGMTVPYLKAYLEQIMPYLNKSYTAGEGPVTTPNTNLIGNLAPVADYNSDPNNTQLMIALSTVESMAVRSDSFNVKIGMYMLETACSNRCGLFIPCNAPNPAGAIVIANLMNDPYVQATYYNIAGNGYNADMSKLDVEQQLYFKSYISQWTAADKPFIDPEDVAKSRTVASIGYREATLSEYANPFIRIE